MGRRIVELLTDDITGDEIAPGEGETITYSVAGIEYRLDLAPKQAKKFHETMQFYIDHSERVGGRRQRGTGSTGKRDKSETQKIKAWADEQGIAYPQRGRLPGSLIEQYEAAN